MNEIQRKYPGLPTMHYFSVEFWDGLDVFCGKIDNVGAK